MTVLLSTASPDSSTGILLMTTVLVSFTTPLTVAPAPTAESSAIFTVVVELLTPRHILFW